MTVVSIEEFRINLDRYLIPTAQEEVILTRDGTPFAVLHPIQENGDEHSRAFAESPEFWRLIHNRRKQQMRTEFFFNRATDPAERLRLGNQHERESLDLQRTASEYQQRLNEQKEAGVKMAQAESEARRAGIQPMRDELNLLQQRYARQSGHAESLGGMNQMQRYQTKGAVKAWEMSGRNFDALPPEMWGSIQQALPQTYAKEIRKRGEKFRAEDGYDMTEEGDNKTLAMIEKTWSEQQMKIELHVGFDEAALAKRIVEAMGGIVAKIDMAARTSARSAEDKVRIGQQTGNAGKR